MSFSINCLEITATKKQWKTYASLYKNLLTDKDYKEFEDKKLRTFKNVFSLMIFMSISNMGR